MGALAKSQLGRSVLLGLWICSAPSLAFSVDNLGRSEIWNTPNANNELVDTSPPAPTAPGLVAVPPQPRPLPPAPAEDTAVTEAAYLIQSVRSATTCPYADNLCHRHSARHRRRFPGKIPTELIVRRRAYRPVRVAENSPAPSPSSDNCIGHAIAAAAKYTVAHIYGNSPASAGYCLMGVGKSLVAAGVGGIHGNGAIDVWSSGSMNAAGFRNLYPAISNPADAPPGAVIVFAGPKTSEYLKTGYFCSHRLMRLRRCDEAAGDWLGHITIKGDDGFYYTDGRTAQPAVNWPQDQNYRRVVGIYVMDHCGRNCSPRLRQACGG